jgi:5-(carboxyamino)imidazole ribonucleotide mutase
MIQIIIGSYRDWPVMKSCYQLLDEFQVSYHIKVLSAHRSPEMLREYIKQAESKIFIAAAGLNASLAGYIAALTIRPVIAVPLSVEPLKGLDSMIACLQMPSGVPVAIMSIGSPGAYNAALLAIQMLSLSDESLAVKLSKYKEKLQDVVRVQDQTLQKEISL